MPMRDHFRMFAGYNRWANERLYTAAATIPDAEYRKDRKGFFKSIHGTFNHILVGDRIWLMRITGQGTRPKTLDEILYDDLASLRVARQAEDARIIAAIDAFDEAALAKPLIYHSMKGDRYEQPMAEILAHFQNHQTHHRGQAHDMLSQALNSAGIEPPSLDLLNYQRERQ